jgi:hypothetical protein
MYMYMEITFIVDIHQSMDRIHEKEVDMLDLRLNVSSLTLRQGSPDISAKLNRATRRTFSASRLSILFCALRLFIVNGIHSTVRATLAQQLCINLSRRGRSQRKL